MKLKGIIFIYINYQLENGQDGVQVSQMFKEINKNLFDGIKEMDYNIVVVPCTKEACRVEKVDFDKPFPRYTAKTHYDLIETTEEPEELC